MILNITCVPKLGMTTAEISTHVFHDIQPAERRRGRRPKGMSNLSPLNFSHTDNLFRNTTTISERCQQTLFSINQNCKQNLKDAVGNR